MIAGSSFRNLSQADLQQVMLICEKLHHADPAASFVHHCHTTLSQAFGKVHFSAEIYQLDPFELREQELHTLDNTCWIPVFKEHLHEHPYIQRLLTITDPHVNMTHMEPTLKAFQRSTLYNEFYTQVEAQNQLWVGIPGGNELLTCIYSRETEYAELHRAMLSIIQPHLESAWKNWKRTRVFKQELDILKEAVFQTPEEESASATIRNRIESLTARQRDVVELVAIGKDNQQIADALKISVLTVKKHLQTIFQSMDIQHRTELAAKWHQSHSVRLY